MTWEELTGLIVGLLVIAGIVLLILHEPRRSTIRVGLFLERHSDNNHDRKEGDSDGT